MKRLVFFSFTKNGDVDDFITYYLRDLARNLTELIVVCNGKLSKQGRAHLKNLPIKLLCAKTRAWMCGPIKPRWIITAGSV